MTDETQNADGAAEEIQSTDVTEQSTDETLLTSNNEESSSDGNEESKEADETTEGDSETESEAEGYADFQLPEGVPLDSVALDKYMPILLEANVSQDLAQKLVDLRAEEVQAQVIAAQEAHTQQVSEWGEQAKTDKEFGGDKLDENLAIAKRGLDAVGSPELTKIFDEWGIGNHPDVIRAFIKVGKMVSEDNPGSGGNAQADKQSVAQRLYPDAQT